MYPSPSLTLRETRFFDDKSDNYTDRKDTTNRELQVGEGAWAGNVF